jgi:hypothetical protein
MKSIRFIFVAVAILPLTSCVLPFYEVPAGTAATATLVNTSHAHDSFKASVFQVDTINGKTSLATPMLTPRGGGPVVTTGHSEVQVPANQPVTVKLTAADQFAADGPALLYSFGGNVAKPATETLTFTPKARTIYVVKGRLGKESSSVWLEERATGRRVK